MKDEKEYHGLISGHWDEAGKLHLRKRGPEGELVGAPARDEAEHFIKCGTCGGWIDCRDLGMVFDHEGTLPHPVCDAPQ